MAGSGDPEHEAIDHGNLIDVGVVEVELEAAEAVGDHPTDEDDSESQEVTG